MEDQLKNLGEQINTLTGKVSNLENQLNEKNKTIEKLEGLVEKISILEKNMISKTDLKINIKLITGKVIEVYVKKTDTIKELKAKIADKENISQSEQYLYLDGKLLDDNLTISQGNIKETSNIYLMKAKDEYINFGTPNERIYIINSLEKNVFRKIKTFLYSARKDGDDANTFHLKCDDQGELLYVVKATNGSFFAIYVSKPLFSDGNTRSDSLQMVISPAHNFSTKSLNSRATYHNASNTGAKFHCMQLNTPFLSSNSVDINSCNDFNLPCYPTGNSSYQIAELEVFSLDKLD